MEKKLEVKNLQVSFRTQAGNVKAVRNISFDLYKGETLAIVGESGSGKSVTSKSIIGILSPNAIVEGGEILYDGQDLLKITEEDFHKIRGDKISMIFQDPMSSLNPIIKVGKQLTEAMILKGKTSQRNARKNFNSKLKLLNLAMNAKHEGEEDVKKTNKEKCDTFNKFSINGLNLELAYNNAHTSAIELKAYCENRHFLISKQQKVDIVKALSKIKKFVKKSTHSYVLNEEKASIILNKIEEFLKLDQKSVTVDQKLEILSSINNIVTESLENDRPNYFRLGYYLLNNPDFDFNSMSIDELNEMTLKYLDDNFMLDFINIATEGVLYSHEKSLEAKKVLLPKLEQALEFYSGELKHKEAYHLAKTLGKEVNKAIDRLEIVKRSSEYSFYYSLHHALDSYFKGLRENPRNQARYDKQQASYQKLIDKNKKPTWKVVPPMLIDLDLEKSNMKNVINSLISTINEEIANEEKYDASKHVIDLIDFFKEQASLYVYKVTKRMAKAKAIKLLEEVGIPEPEMRYNQYPFEFSGGMRQRIVIAIALSANPDILICDEPTTALDVTIQSQILELINKIKEERHLSVIFITHDLGVVANMADRIAVMYAGKIVEYGTSEDIFYDPKHPYTWALLSSMPDLDTKDKLDAIPGTPPNMIYPPKGDAFAERNKYALEIDFEQEPPMFEVTPTHYAATWLLHPNAPKVNPPKIILDRIARMKEATNNEQ